MRTLKFGEHAKICTIRLYSWEKNLVKEFLKKIREDKIKYLQNKKSVV